MTGRISRTRAFGAIWLFALIVTAWASVSAQESQACTVDPCTTDPVVVCDYYGDQDCSLAKGVAVGTAGGVIGEGASEAFANAAAVTGGTDLCAGSFGCVPSGPVGAPVSDGAGVYEDTTGKTFTSNQACVAADSAASGSSRAAADLGQPCGDNNKYYCWDLYVYMARDYADSIYWHWQTHLSWCGYTMGKITSHSYDDHNVLATGYQCENTEQRRTPLEKIDGGHWQQHSHFTYRCRIKGAFKDDHPTEGAHYYSNGYYEEIRKGN